MGGASVNIAGRLVPLLYAGEGQINAQLPYDLPVNTTHQLIVRRGFSYTLPEPVTVAAAQPAIFTRSQTGQGQGLIFTAEGRLADASHPVGAGEVVVMYGVGLGAVNPPVAAGVAAAGLSRTVQPVTVTVGAVEARVLYAGLAPGFAGLYQVNAEVPAGVPAGEAAVVLTVAAQASPPVTMAVR